MLVLRIRYHRIKRLTFTSEINARSHNMDPEHCAVLEKGNSIRKNPQQILALCSLGSSPDQRGHLVAESTGAIPTIPK
jgi:hypothetical protein